MLDYWIFVTRALDYWIQDICIGITGSWKKYMDLLHKFLKELLGFNIWNNWISILQNLCMHRHYWVYIKITNDYWILDLHEKILNIGKVLLCWLKKWFIKIRCCWIRKDYWMYIILNNWITEYKHLMNIYYWVPRFWIQTFELFATITTLQGILNPSNVQTSWITGSPDYWIHRIEKKYSWKIPSHQKICEKNGSLLNPSMSMVCYWKNNLPSSLQNTKNYKKNTGIIFLFAWNHLSCEVQYYHCRMDEVMSQKRVPCPHEPVTNKTLKKIIEKNRARPAAYWITGL